MEPAERDLGCGSLGVDPDSPTALYDWAQLALERAPRAEEPAKLRLARALAVLDDQQWHGSADSPLSAAQPRHRVIARLAREHAWGGGLWSLNWDTLLEAAMESVGLERGPGPETQPWPHRLAVILTATDLPGSAERNVVRVFKPHGCAQGMRRAAEAYRSGDLVGASKLAERFMITREELDTRPHDASAADQAFFDKLHDRLRDDLAILLGWRAVEKRLTAAFSRAVGSGQARPPGDLTVVDKEFNDAGHAEILSCYQLAQGDVYFPVHDQHPSCDDIFLWMQAVRAWTELERWCPTECKPGLRAHLDALGDCGAPTFFTTWVDAFLPDWIRFCWRAGVVTYPNVSRHAIDTERGDHYIPLSGGGDRNDVAAAARLLARLPPDGGDWDASRYRGCLWNRKDGRLLIPMPTWQRVAELAALPALVHKERRIDGFVTFCEVVPLGPLRPEQHTEVSTEELRQSLAAVMRVAQCRLASDIGVAGESLEGPQGGPKS